MGIGSLGLSEMAIIFLIVLVLFGPRRFPEIARSMGHAMREFRRSLNQIQRELEEADPRTVLPNRRRFAPKSGSAKPGTEETEPAPESASESGTEPASPSTSGPGDPDQIPMFGEGPPTVDSPSEPSTTSRGSESG